MQQWIKSSSRFPARVHFLWVQNYIYICAAQSLISVGSLRNPMCLICFQFGSRNVLWKFPFRHWICFSMMLLLLKEMGAWHSFKLRYIASFWQWKGMGEEVIYSCFWNKWNQTQVCSVVILEKPQIRMKHIVLPQRGTEGFSSNFQLVSEAGSSFITWVWRGLFLLENDCAFVKYELLTYLLFQLLSNHFVVFWLVSELVIYF